eukprot:1157395-Pelagomonas_calceolata.AAC.5
MWGFCPSSTSGDRSTGYVDYSGASEVSAQGALIGRQGCFGRLQGRQDAHVLNKNWLGPRRPCNKKASQCRPNTVMCSRACHGCSLLTSGFLPTCRPCMKPPESLGWEEK